MDLHKASKGESTAVVLKRSAEFSKGDKSTASISQTQRDSDAKLKNNIQTYMKQLAMTGVHFWVKYTYTPKISLEVLE